MALLSDNDTVMLTIRGDLLAQTILSTFYFRVVGSPNPDLDQSAAFDLIDTAIVSAGNIQTKFLGVVPGNYTLRERRYQVIDPVRFVSKSYFSALGGQSGSAAATANIAAVITRTTERSGRDQVGSLHIPIGVGEDGADNGVVSGTTLAGLIALSGQLIVPINTGSYILNPVLGPPTNNPGDFRRISRTIAQSTVRVMRRRTLGLGI